MRHIRQSHSDGVHGRSSQLSLPQGLRVRFAQKNPPMTFPQVCPNSASSICALVQDSHAG